MRFPGLFWAKMPGVLGSLTGSADYGIWFGIGMVLSLFGEQAIQMLKT